MDRFQNQTISTIFLRHVNFSSSDYVKPLNCEAENKYGRENKDFVVKIIQAGVNLKERKTIDLLIAIFFSATIIILLGFTFYYKYTKQKNVSCVNLSMPSIQHFSFLIKFFDNAQAGLNSKEIRAFYQGEDREVLKENEVDSHLNENILSQPYNKSFEIQKSDLKFGKEWL